VITETIPAVRLMKVTFLAAGPGIYEASNPCPRQKGMVAALLRRDSCESELRSDPHRRSC
jgi:hypothetical protein